MSPLQTLPQVRWVQSHPLHGQHDDCTILGSSDVCFPHRGLHFSQRPLAHCKLPTVHKHHTHTLRTPAHHLLSNRPQMSVRHSRCSTQFQQHVRQRSMRLSPRSNGACSPSCAIRNHAPRFFSSFTPNLPHCILCRLVRSNDQRGSFVGIPCCASAACILLRAQHLSHAIPYHVCNS